MVEVVVAVGVGGGVPQDQDVSPTGWQGWLGGGQVGARSPQGGGLPWQMGQNHGVAVEQRRGCCLEDELGALDALVLVAHVTVELSGGVAAGTGLIRLGDGLWRVRLDQASPVNQTGRQWSTQSGTAVGQDVSIAVGVVDVLPSLGGPGSLNLNQNRPGPDQDRNREDN